MTNPPLVVGVRHAGNRALRTAFALNTHKHPDHYDIEKQTARHPHIFVPLREPLSIAISWYRRPRGKHVKFIKDEFESLARIARRAESVTAFTMDRYRKRSEQMLNASMTFNRPVVDVGRAPMRPIFIPPEIVLYLYTEVLPVYEHDFVREHYRDFGPAELTEILDELADERRMCDPFGNVLEVYDRRTGRQKR